MSWQTLIRSEVAKSLTSNYAGEAENIIKAACKKWIKPGVSTTNQYKDFWIGIGNNVFNIFAYPLLIASVLKQGVNKTFDTIYCILTGQMKNLQVILNIAYKIFKNICLSLFLALEAICYVLGKSSITLIHIATRAPRG